jgi:uncharacterized protein (TIGR02246 family)
VPVGRPAGSPVGRPAHIDATIPVFTNGVPVSVTDEVQIQTLFEDYQRSLNTSDARLAASLYTADATFMPTQLPTAQGADMEAAYEKIFEMIRLEVTFSIDELEIFGADVAHAMTHSAGTQTVLASGARSAEANREMYLLRRIDGTWKIARYMFNKAD